MGNEASKNYGAKGQSALLMFDPETLTIIKDPAHPLYDERIDLPIDEPTVLSIMEVGVINPIIVRKNKDTNEIEVVAGRQRTMCTIEANKRLVAEGKEKKLIPGTICKTAGSPGALMSAMVIDNELRRNDGIYVKAKKAKRLLDFGVPIENVASNFGVVPQSIKNYLQVLDCSKAVIAALDSGELSADAAKKFSSLKHEEQDKLLKDMRTAGATKGRKANKKLEQATGRPSAVLGMGKKQIKAIYDNLVEMNKAFPTFEKYEFGMLVVKGILEDTPLPFCPFMADMKLDEVEKESLRRFEVARHPDKDADPSDFPTSDVLVGPKKKKVSSKIETGIIDLDGDDEEEELIVDLDSEDEEEEEDVDSDLDTSELAVAIEAQELANNVRRGRPRKAV